VPDRTFTLEEANALLAELRPVAERMVDLRRHHLEAIDRRDELAARIGSNGGGISAADVLERDAQIEQLAAALEAVIDRILEAGVQVKDIEAGLLDFPSLREGEVVLLCWRVGEGEIEYWHTVDEGFAGRKPVDPVE
jgi:hypothetical protein